MVRYLHETRGRLGSERGAMAEYEKSPEFWFRALVETNREIAKVRRKLERIYYDDKKTRQVARRYLGLLNQREYIVRRMIWANRRKQG